MNLALSVANLSDEGSVVELLAAQFAEHDIDLDTVALARGVRGLLSERHRGIAALARRDGAAVGLACLPFTWTLEHGGPSAWLDELYVRPDHRGQGIGASLLRYVCHVAEQRGCLAIDLEVEATHERAARLYERHGFERHNRQRFFKRLAGPRGPAA